MELFQGIGHNVYLIARGYPIYNASFIIIHFIIIVTGVLFVRQVSAKAEVAERS